MAIAPWFDRLSRLLRLTETLVSLTQYFPVGVRCLPLRPRFALLRQEFWRFVTELPTKLHGRSPFQPVGYIYSTIRDLDEEHFSGTLPLAIGGQLMEGPLRG